MIPAVPVRQGFSFLFFPVFHCFFNRRTGKKGDNLVYLRGEKLSQTSRIVVSSSCKSFWTLSAKGASNWATVPQAKQL
jgi:hypothetical protein